MTQDSSSGITVTRVSRSFNDVVAVADASFNAPAGKVTALIGPNGSGKTTLLKILAGLMSLDGGTISIDGLDPVADRRQARLQVGWMPDVFDVSKEMTVRGLLEFFAKAYQMDRVEAAERIACVLDLTRLTDLADQPAHNLSRGQIQKLGLARALLHVPSYLLLDEPDAGLDPDSRAELRDILRQFTRDGGTVLMSTHDLDEMHDLADGAVVIREGVTSAWQAMAQTKSTSRWRVTALDREALVNTLDQRGIPWSDGGEAVELPLMESDAAATILRALVLADVAVVTFGPAHSALHSLYTQSAERNPS